MSYTYDQRKRPQAQNAAAERTTAPGPDLNALMTGAARPSAAQKGRSIDLDAAMKAKMENAFGDLSAVKLYESSAVGEAGAEAIAQGNEIAFAPGMANFSSRSGQERLGHELSHVMSQRSGAVRGAGFLNSPSLEARADREGGRRGTAGLRRARHPCRVGRVPVPHGRRGHAGQAGNRGGKNRKQDGGNKGGRAGQSGRNQGRKGLVLE